MFTLNELELLEKIRMRPEMFLGKKSLERLFIYFLGYSHAEMKNQQNYSKKESCNSIDFQQYVMNRYNIYSYYNAFDIIRLQCSSDEVAYDKFYELLDEFLAAKENLL